MATALHKKVSSAMTGIAAHTGNRGFATSPWMMAAAIGARKNMCMRYMPYVSFDKDSQKSCLFGCWDGDMQVKSKKMPKVAHNTFGVQNSQLHSNMGVSMYCPGTPFHQNDQAVKAAPIKKKNKPSRKRRLRDHCR